MPDTPVRLTFVPPAEPDQAPPVSWARAVPAAAVRMAGPWVGGLIGGIGGGLVGEGVGAIPGAYAGSVAGGSAGETLAQLIEGRQHLNKTAIATSGALGLIPGAASVAKARPLVAAGLGALEGAGVTAATKWAEGDKNALHPTQWSTSEKILGPTIGALAGGMTAKIVKGRMPSEVPSIDPRNLPKAADAAPAVTSRPRQVFRVKAPTVEDIKGKKLSPETRQWVEESNRPYHTPPKDEVQKIQAVYNDELADAGRKAFDEGVAKAKENSAVLKEAAQDTRPSEGRATRIDPYGPEDVVQGTTPGRRFAVAAPEKAQLPGKVTRVSASPEAASEATRAALAKPANPKMADTRVRQERTATAAAERTEVRADEQNLGRLAKEAKVAEAAQRQKGAEMAAANEAVIERARQQATAEAQNVKVDEARAKAQLEADKLAQMRAAQQAVLDEGGTVHESIPGETISATDPDSGARVSQRRTISPPETEGGEGGASGPAGGGRPAPITPSAARIVEIKESLGVPYSIASKLAMEEAQAKAAGMPYELPKTTPKAAKPAAPVTPPAPTSRTIPASSPIIQQPPKAAEPVAPKPAAAGVPPQTDSANAPVKPSTAAGAPAQPPVPAPKPAPKAVERPAKRNGQVPKTGGKPPAPPEPPAAASTKPAGPPKPPPAAPPAAVPVPKEPVPAAKPTEAVAQPPKSGLPVKSTAKVETLTPEQAHEKALDEKFAVKEGDDAKTIASKKLAREQSPKYYAKPEGTVNEFNVDLTGDKTGGDVKERILSYLNSALHESITRPDGRNGDITIRVPNGPSFRVPREEKAIRGVIQRIERADDSMWADLGDKVNPRNFQPSAEKAPAVKPSAEAKAGEAALKGAVKQLQSAIKASREKAGFTSLDVDDNGRILVDGKPQASINTKRGKIEWLANSPYGTEPIDIEYKEGYPAGYAKEGASIPKDAPSIPKGKLHKEVLGTVAQHIANKAGAGTVEVDINGTKISVSNNPYSLESTAKRIGSFKDTEAFSPPSKGGLPVKQSTVKEPAATADAKAPKKAPTELERSPKSVEEISERTGVALPKESKAVYQPNEGRKGGPYAGMAKPTTQEKVFKPGGTAKPEGVVLERNETQPGGWKRTPFPPKEAAPQGNIKSQLKETLKRLVKEESGELNLDRLSEVRMPDRAFLSRFMDKLPNYQRSALLSHPWSLAWNSWAGPWGSQMLGGLERYAGAGEQGGLRIMRRGINLPEWNKEFWGYSKEAGRKVALGEEGRAGMTGGSMGLGSRIMRIPAQLMMQGDMVARNAFAREGVPESVYRKLTNTAEPSTKFSQGIQNFARTGGPAAQMVLPFHRTALNIMENGIERLPGIGLVTHAVRQTGAPRQLQAAQQLIGLGDLGLSYLAGRYIPEDAADRYKIANLVSNISGPYAMLGSMGYFAGRAAQRHGNAGKQFGAAVGQFQQGVPVPTLEVVNQYTRIPRALIEGRAPNLNPLSDRTDLPSSLVPKALTPTMKKFIMDAISGGGSSNGAGPLEFRPPR